MKLEGKRVLITGGKGYLGSHLMAKLKTMGANVYQLSIEPATDKNEYQVNILDKDKLTEVIQTIQPQIIYHLAASLDRARDFSNYHKIVSVNVDGTLNLLEALNSINYENFIFTSSSEIYGNNHSPFKEEQAALPVSPYSLSKTYAEDLIRTYSGMYSKNYTILRIFNFYGKNMPESFFIPQMINTLQRGESFEMTLGEQARDFLHVDDIVQGLILAGTNTKAHNDTLNVCSAEATTLSALAKEIGKVLEAEDRIKLGAIPYRSSEVWEMLGDNSKIKENLGFKPSISLSEGIASIIK